MAISYSVTLSKVIREFDLKTFYMPADGEKTKIYAMDINRPTLPLVGYFDQYDKERVQLLGYGELGYLKQFSEEDVAQRFDRLCSYRPPVIILTRDLDPPEPLMAAAQKYGVPLMGTPEKTSPFMSSLVTFLNIELAPRITRHGVLLEVHGEGILLMGESGVGKSETAIELIKRGHRLIADDAVEIRRISNKTLVGTSPENIRHFMELRGVGIINARKIFGIGSVKVTQKINFVIQLEAWDSKKVYDRMGLDSETVDILGIKVNSTTIPVKPGRNLAVIIEVAAMNNRQKEMGYNASTELLKRLGMIDNESEDINLDWENY